MSSAPFLRLSRCITGVAISAALIGAISLVGSAPTAAASGFRVTDEFHPTISVVRTGTLFADSQSNNWSGYNQGVLDTETPFSSISAEWVVPTASQHTAGQAEDSATWIGIGGGCLNSSCALSDETLIQAGTEQDVSLSGAVTYDAWWEILPLPEFQSTIAVHPGDTIKCTIASTVPGLWTITLQDTTDGQGFTESVPYASDESTAEWIEETPTEIGTSGAGLAALPNLTTVVFNDATVNGANANLVPDQAIQLVDANGNPLATPSPPVGGDEFADCAFASTCASP
jgi:Peptidase A4 family